jgi:hypothetical protein
MTTGSSISQQLERQSVVSMESTIPTGMTIEQWRRRRSARPRPARRRSPRALAAARRLVPLRPVPCDHLHDTTTRYNADQKQLSFLLICPTCGTEKAVETVPYEPQFQPHHSTNPAQQSAGATIHQLPARRHQQPIPRAA